MSEEKKVCPYCGSCGGCGTDDSNPTEEEKTDEKKAQKMTKQEEFHLAILLALVPAMAMSFFNLAGII